MAEETSFDWAPIRSAYLAADYSACRKLLEGAPRQQAEIWLARMEIREARPADALARLRAITSTDNAILAERDVWIAATYYNTGDFELAHQLLDRAIPTLAPRSELFYRAINVRALNYYLAGDYAAAEPFITCLIKAPFTNDRAQGFSLRGFLAAKRENLREHYRYTLMSVTEYAKAPEPDQYSLTHNLVGVAVKCREMPADGALDVLRELVPRVAPAPLTAFARFQIARTWGWIDALQGDEVSAIRRWREAQVVAPSEFWSVFCVVDRAYLALAMGRIETGRELLMDAHRTTSELPWAETREDERIILLTIAQLFADWQPALTQRYLATFRSLASDMHSRMGWVGDRRTKALQLYPQGIALVHLGETEAAIEMLQEAWEIFTHFEYGWRAASAAFELYNATKESQWLERAREQISPWPMSWIAKTISAESERTNA